MLTPGERRFRRGLHIVIGLLVATTALLAMSERAQGPQPAAATRADR